MSSKSSKFNHCKDYNKDYTRWYKKDELEEEIKDCIKNIEEDEEEQQTKNLCLGDPEKFKNALDEIIEENKEGFERLAKS